MAIPKKRISNKRFAFIVAAGLIIILATIYIVYRIKNSERTLIHLSMLPLLAGLIFEYKRVSKKWSTVLWTALASFVLSFIAFMPGKRERNYVFEEHIQTWPFVFLGIFILIAIVVHAEAATSQLTEGITLLQSIAAIYWVIDSGFWETGNLFMKILILAGLLLSLFSIFHAFSYSVLSKKTRLVLSVWSSVIMILFAIDNISSVYKNEEIETITVLSRGIYIALQYFLLGVSSIYMAQNFIMLIGFLPGKGTFFNSQYFRNINDLSDSHVFRYSSDQVTRFDSLFCLLFAVIVFLLNHYYQFVPRTLIIWAVFAIFPYVLYLYYGLNKK